MRDDFTAGTKELLARRVAFICSNPECQQPTSGPQVDPVGVVNIGVAAHISAASPGGARYEEDLSSEHRADSSNGIWLCQTCAKLIDNDPIRFTRAVLEGWKRAAERSAAVALTQRRNSDSASQPGHAKIERLTPSLLEEMREDVRSNPTTREFVVLKRGWVYNSRGPYLAYYLDEHDDLENKLQVLVNLGLVQEITYNIFIWVKHARVTAVPEPTGLTLAAIAFFGLIGCVLRPRRR